MENNLAVYKKLKQEEPKLSDMKCKCGSLHFRVEIEWSLKNVTFKLLCARCKYPIANVWVGDWQIPREIEEKCSKCDSEWFRVKSEHEGTIATIYLECNRCGKKYPAIGIGVWQAIG